MFRLALCATVLLLPALAAQDAPNQERTFLSRVCRLTVEGKRAGEGYWAPDGKRLAAAGNDDFVVWDVATWQPVMKVQRPPAAKVAWNSLPAAPAGLGTTGSGAGRARPTPGRPDEGRPDEGRPDTGQIGRAHV